nr:MAG TPA: hypothetical protein [Caudoviricetes sp.]
MLLLVFEGKRDINIVYFILRADILIGCHFRIPNPRYSPFL